VLPPFPNKCDKSYFLFCQLPPLQHTLISLVSKYVKTMFFSAECTAARNVQLQFRTILATSLEKAGRDSSVGKAAVYGLDGPGIESRCEVRFSAPVQTGPGAHSASYIMDTGSFPGVKPPERGADHPHPSSAQVKGRVDLYIHSSSGPRDLF
jgi:hypothetical protein